MQHTFWVVKSAGSDYNFENPILRDVVSIGNPGDEVTIRFVVRLLVRDYGSFCQSRCRPITPDPGSYTVISTGTWRPDSQSCSLKVSTRPPLLTPHLVRWTSYFRSGKPANSIFAIAAWDELCPKYNALSSKQKVKPKKGTAI